MMVTSPVKWFYRFLYFFVIYFVIDRNHIFSYILIIMRNRDQLSLGSKPAPGDLAFVQAFVNIILDLENNREIDRLKILRNWMAHHGLIASSADISRSDYRKAVSLHNSLRALLSVSDGQDMEKSTINALNRLVDEFKLSYVFKSDATIQLKPSGSGINKALGLLLAEVIMSMTDGRWQRLKICSDPTCRWIYYDFSKNHSGRWCSMLACGARSKAKAYRKRQADRYSKS